MNTKTKRIIGWLLAAVVAFFFLASGLLKLSGSQATQEMAKTMGGMTNVLSMGVLELVITVLFLYPRTGIVGALLMIAYAGGAMAVHLVNGQSIGLFLVVQILIWSASAVRFPELTQRLFGSPGTP